MEEDATIQAQACKFSSIQTNKIASNNNNNNTSEEVNNNGELRKRSSEGWQHNSSRIIRVSRASGGKDRHSKVMTSKGLRDRRVRLSVTTAIQFYDLQDRLGYDQPSKAVEWLIKAASDAISDLPSLNTNFPETPKQQATDDKRGHVKCITMGGNEDMEASLNFQVVNNQSHNLSLSKSACSSTSETSKGSGSGLSLSRSEIRVKARERARERTTKEKEKQTDEPCCNNNNIVQHNSNNNNSDVVMSIAQSSSSFTELLTGVPAATSSPTGQHQHQHHHHRSDEVDVFNKSTRQHHQWGLGVAPMDYFNTSNQFSGQMLLGNSVAHHHHQGMSVAQFGVIHVESNNNNHHHHQQQQHHQSDQLQHFSFLPDHFGGGGGSSEYNLNFSISSSSCNDNNNSRGTLQSNLSPSFLLPQLQLQRLSTSPLDGSSNFPFFIAPPAAVENQHHHQHHQQQQHHQEFSPELDGGLQLCYGDGSRHSDHKGKGKN